MFKYVIVWFGFFEYFYKFDFDVILSDKIYFLLYCFLF